MIRSELFPVLILCSSVSLLLLFVLFRSVFHPECFHLFVQLFVHNPSILHFLSSKRLLLLMEHLLRYLNQKKRRLKDKNIRLLAEMQNVRMIAKRDVQKYWLLC